MAVLGGGTHGYIKAYRYNISKHDLEKAVHHVITTNPDIRRDSVKSYYNNDTNYITISIVENGKGYNYIFHFYGGKKYWDTATTSAISISYAYDEKGKGGSSGNKGVKWYDFGLKKKLVELFERELINEIDSILKMKHIEE